MHMKSVLNLFFLLLAQGCGYETALDLRGQESNDAATPHSLATNTATDAKKIDVYVIAGQSNAIGTGHDQQYEEKPIDSLVSYFAYQWLTGPNYFAAGCDVGPCAKNLEQASWVRSPANSPGPIVPLKNRLDAELSLIRNLSRDYYQNSPHPIGVLKFAVGSTSIERDWLPSDNQAHLKQRLISFVQDHMQEMRARGLQPSIRGLVWIQGEADRDPSLGSASNYGQSLQTVIDAFRFQTGAFHAAAGIVQLNSLSTDPSQTTWLQNVNKIRQAQRQFVDQDRIAALIPVDELPHDPGSPLHYTREGYDRLGAETASRLIPQIRKAVRLERVGGSYLKNMLRHAESPAEHTRTVTRYGSLAINSDVDAANPSDRFAKFLIFFFTCRSLATLSSAPTDQRSGSPQQRSSKYRKIIFDFCIVAPARIRALSFSTRAAKV